MTFLAPAANGLVDRYLRARRRTLNRGRRTGKSRRRRRLHYSIDLDKGLPVLQVWMRGRFGKRQYRRKTRVGTLEQLTPLIACTR